jgi:hypothetical protein
VVGRKRGSHVREAVWRASRSHAATRAAKA